MKPLILGHGLMGAEIVRQTGWQYTARPRMDITKPDTLKRYFSRGCAQFNPIINCVGFTKTLQPEREPAWSVNYVGVMDLVDLCNKWGVKLVHISTDFIYAGSKHPSSVDDCPVHYSNWYTYSKLLADAYIQARCQSYLLIRTSYKARPFPYDSAFTQRTGNFDYVDVIASKIIMLVNNNVSGVVNVGTEPKTMYDLAVQTKPEVSKNDNIVTPSDTTMII